MTWLVRSVVALVVVLATAFAVAHGVAWWREQRVRAAWAEDFGPWQDVLDRYPPREANDVALRVEELAAAMGLQVAPAGGRGRPDEAASRHLKQVRSEMKPWLRAQLASAVSDVETPPESWSRFRAEHDVTLGELRALLTAAETPAWGRDALTEPVRHGRRGSSDFIGGAFQLQELLLADALASLAEGDTSAALAGLEAASAHARALAEIPDLLSGLIRVACLREQLGLARKIGARAGPWLRGFDMRDERRGFREAMVIDSRRVFEAGADVPGPPPLSEADFPESVLMRAGLPLVRWESVSWSDAALCAHRAIGTRLRPCEPAPPPSEVLATDSASDSRLAIVAPNLVEAAERVERLARDTALTQRLLALQSARAATGAWPEELPAMADEACPNVGWTYERREDGSAVLALDPVVDWSERSSGLVLPERVQLIP